MRLVDARFEAGMALGYDARLASPDCLTERDLGVGGFCMACSPLVHWACTRPPGHIGDHVAHTSRTHVAARWENQTEG